MSQDVGKGPPSSSSLSHRRELLETVESQRETISKYETRLRDVVRAYKGLVKEKEALEASVKAVASKEGDEDGGGRSDQSRPEDGDKQQQQQHFESKIRTLASSLSALTEEKKRLEGSFQEDRKRMIADRKEKDKTIETLQKELSAIRTKAKSDFDEIKSKLIVERHERERETSDHAVMIRELQRLLADERRSREKLTEERTTSSNLESNNKNIPKSSSSSSLNKAMDQHNNDLEKQRMAVVDLEGKLKVREKEAEAGRVEIERMRKERAEAKASHERELSKCERRAADAESRLSSARAEQELRVNSLEARLQDLSETVGKYDRLRRHDQEEIAGLRERLEATRTMTRRESVVAAVREEEEGERDVQGMLERMFRMGTKIKEANDRSQNPIDIDSLINTNFGGNANSEDSATRWKRECESLKEELDTYRRRNNTSSSSNNGGRYALPEVDQDAILTLKTQLSELQDRNNSLRIQLLSSQKDLNDSLHRESDTKEMLHELRRTSSSKSESLESDYRGKVSMLETELQRQRERCLKMIEEKEDEVRGLRSSMERSLEEALTASASSSSSMASAVFLASNAGRSGSRGGGLVTDGMRASSSLGGSNNVGGLGEVVGGGGGMVLHYSQEISHRDVEISHLRQKVFELESTMRELQLSAVAKEERLTEEMETLQEALARMRRMSPGKEGSANMEYLKNVVLSYMLGSDAGSREHMLKAIGAVLLFSKHDFRKVRDYNAAWWWSHGQKK